MVFSLTLADLVTRIMVIVGEFFYNIVPGMFVLLAVLAPMIIVFKVIHNVFRPKKIFN